MRDEISMLVLIAAGRGDKNMIEYLLSFHGDIININAQNKVRFHGTMYELYMMSLVHLVGWKDSIASSYFVWSGRLY